MSTLPNDDGRRKARFYADGGRKPAVPPPDPAGIPAALKAERRWVPWGLAWKPGKGGGGKWDKPPLQACGRKAKSNDPDTWTDFDTALAACRADPERFAGVGFVLGDGWVGIDADDVRDPACGSLLPWAAELVRAAGTYADVSPSGTGLKLIGRGVWRGGWHKRPHPGGGEVEVYDRQYFTVVGVPAVGSGADAGDIQPALDLLTDGPAGDAAESADAPPPRDEATVPGDRPRGGGAADSDDDLIARAGRARNGAKFRSLMAGDAGAYNGDASRADLALCNLLAYWCGGPDADRIDLLFRRSALFRPEKWDARHAADGRTYGQLTVAAALDGRTEYYTPRPPAGRRAGGAAGDDAEDADGGKASAADVLAGIAAETFDLWHDARRAFATAGRQTYAVRSNDFRLALTRAYRERTGGRVPSGEAMGAALNAVEAAAVLDGTERPAAVRLAGHGGRIYLHLADNGGTVIEVDADGWRPCADPPVRFVTPSTMLPLPVPLPGGSVADLRRFVNARDDDAFALMLAWLSAALRPTGPFPVAAVTGEAGSAKSTTVDVFKALADPAKAVRRGSPKELRDLMIAAARQWVASYDNLRGLSEWLSDALCRLATGGGFATRRLYTDGDEEVFEATRPVVLSGITDYADAPDLLDRALVLRLRPIPDGRRVSERVFWPAFRAAHPALLGALLDRVAGGLRALPGVTLADPPRMADFCEWAVACEIAAGEPPRFLAAYAANRREAHELALESSPVAAAVAALMAGRQSWSGPAAELLKALDPFGPDPRGRDWPRAANRLTGVLRTLAPDLRRAWRLEVDCDGRTPERGRLVTITRPAPGGRDGPDDPARSGGGEPVPPDDTAFPFGANA